MTLTATCSRRWSGDRCHGPRGPTSPPGGPRPCPRWTSRGSGGQPRPTPLIPARPSGPATPYSRPLLRRPRKRPPAAQTSQRVFCLAVRSWGRRTANHPFITLAAWPSSCAWLTREGFHSQSLPRDRFHHRLFTLAVSWPVTKHVPAAPSGPSGKSHPPSTPMSGVASMGYYMTIKQSEFLRSRLHRYPACRLHQANEIRPD